MQLTHEQARTLQQPAAEAFPARAAQFLAREYPALAERVGAQAMAALVEHGQRRAALHGFTGERDIVQYLLVMLRLGPRFDEDPALVTLQPFLDAASTLPVQWRLNVLLSAARRRPEPGERHGTR